MILIKMSSIVPRQRNLNNSWSFREYGLKVFRCHPVPSKKEYHLIALRSTEVRNHRQHRKVITIGGPGSTEAQRVSVSSVHPKKKCHLIALGSTGRMESVRNICALI